MEIERRLSENPHWRTGNLQKSVSILAKEEKEISIVALDASQLPEQPPPSLEATDGQFTKMKSMMTQNMKQRDRSSTNNTAKAETNNIERRDETRRKTQHDKKRETRRSREPRTINTERERTTSTKDRRNEKETETTNRPTRPKKKKKRNDDRPPPSPSSFLPHPSPSQPHDPLPPYHPTTASSHPSLLPIQRLVVRRLRLEIRAEIVKSAVRVEGSSMRWWRQGCEERVELLGGDLR